MVETERVKHLDRHNIERNGQSRIKYSDPLNQGVKIQGVRVLENDQFPYIRLSY